MIMQYMLIITINGGKPNIVLHFGKVSVTILSDTIKPVQCTAINARIDLRDPVFFTDIL